MGQLYMLFIIVNKLDPLVNNKCSNKSVKTTFVVLSCPSQCPEDNSTGIYIHKHTSTGQRLKFHG